MISFLVEKGLKPTRATSNRGYALATGRVFISSAAKEVPEHKKQDSARGIFIRNHKTVLFFNRL